jgi:hypothetical protein
MLINIHRIVSESWLLLLVGHYSNGLLGGFRVASRRRCCYRFLVWDLLSHWAARPIEIHTDSLMGSEGEDAR